MRYSTVSKSDLDDIVFRLDAEFYQRDHLDLSYKIDKFRNCSLFDAGVHIDCSAFYPSIVPYYGFERSGIPFLRVNEIQDGLLDLTDGTVFLPRQILNENNSTIARCQPRDLIIAKGGNSLGKVALLTDQFQEYSICRDLIVLKTNNLKNVNRFYLWIFLHSSVGQKILLRTASQTGQPHLTVEAIGKIKIPLFSDSFQDLFESLLNQSEILKSKGLKLYDEAEQILLSELGLLNWKPKHRLSFVKNFSDTQSANRIDSEYFQPMYEEMVKAIKLSRDFACLGDIASIRKCVEPGSESYGEDGIPFLRVSNLSKFGINNDNQQFLSEALYDTLKMHQPKKGEILVSKDATPGIAFYLKDALDKTIPSSGILRMTVKDAQNVHPEYLTLILNSIIVQKQIERDAGGSIINHWRVDQVKNTLIPILPVSVQKQISKRIDESFFNREQSKHLLDIAKRGVEMAIEKNEKAAQNWIEAELKKLGGKL